MPAVKSMDRIVEKWKRVAGAAGAEYTEGIQNPRADWATQTKEAEPRYEAGVQASINRKGFGKGVTKAGTVKWQAMSVAKGPSRWSAGISLSGDAYREGFEPYARVLTALTLPARGARGDPKNIERVRKVAEALHNEKVKRAGG
jgi:hypothetical protein